MINFIFLLIIPLVSFANIPGRFTGEVRLETRGYLKEGAYNNPRQDDISLSFAPEYSYSWEEDRKVFSFMPFFRANNLDKEKNIIDIRELSFVGSYETMDLRIGVSKVFWGVTESLHLVDFINQTDFVANIDTETKLGQAMVNPTFITEYGNFAYFFLPLFRERTFPSEDGRLRGLVLIDVDNPIYKHEDEENHIDHAIRWSHYYESFEWAISYFYGTDREPLFRFNPSTSKIDPFYSITKQLGVELLYVYEDWIFKLEHINKNTSGQDPFKALVTGFEYTFSNKFGGIDIGILYEYIRDERDENSTLGLYNHSFIGSRIAFNDEQSMDLLFGGIFENETNNLASFRIEGSRRIGQSFKAQIEANILSAPSSGSILYAVKDDDYVQASLSYYY